MTAAAAIHHSAILIDTHADTPQRFVDENWSFTDPLNGGMLNYDSARQGNLASQFFAIRLCWKKSLNEAAAVAASNGLADRCSMLC
jgi:hypothetical protein